MMRNDSDVMRRTVVLIMMHPMSCNKAGVIKFHHISSLVHFFVKLIQGSVYNVKSVV